ncbi:uncharacterized protein LOC130571097 [Triplophysa rosa]|uniref:Bcl-2-like protein 15-like n=1 Tax=Triplophysa rosa TaxID=992332 RepID=A0A9W7TBK3_TRIRA|nr:uncharacterized protein LOC130571097 [Triplophysa rosa]KAI7795520.1 putative bcl-2-like protein 15-like [Triplophysa rosa]
MKPKESRCSCNDRLKEEKASSREQKTQFYDITFRKLVTRWLFDVYIHSDSVGQRRGLDVSRFPVYRELEPVNSMAPANIHHQTYTIIHCLLQDDHYEDSMIEHDGCEDENAFDAVKIASKLRELGDDYDEKFIQPLIKNVQDAAADQVVSAFSDSVDSLCKMWVVERAEVASEKQLLKAAVTVGLVFKKNCPDMTSVIESAMAGFVNNRLTSWIAQQGGWVSVSKSSTF